MDDGEDNDGCVGKFVSPTDNDDGGAPRRAPAMPVGPDKLLDRAVGPVAAATCAEPVIRDENEGWSEGMPLPMPAV
jgi:hypothetical protein